MKRRALSLAACVVLLSCLCLPAPARQATYRNPVVAGNYPDPSVMRVGDVYWAATTTGDWAPHFALLRSRDLVNWQKVGYVFQTKPAWAKGDFWAPEIVNDRGRFFVFYVARRDEGPKKRGTLCVAVATSQAPEGPYTDRGPLVCQIPERGGVGSIDPAFVRDERGQPFLVWKADGNDARPMQPTSIYAQPLSEDGTKLLGKRKEILRNDAPWEGNVTEGSFILRRGDWFYHFYAGNACCGRACDYAEGVARARHLLGPWEKYARNPIVAANRDWQCPGHGSVVETPDGRDFLLYHSYRWRPDTFSVGREAVLDEVKWMADGWPVVDDGRGPSSVAPSPFGDAGGETEAELFDGFVDARLSPEWQWPLGVEQTARVEVAGGGHLVLEPATALAGGPASSAGDAPTGAVVARRTTSGDYVATALVDARGMTVAARAGLAVYGWRDASIGVAAGGGKVTVWRREGKDECVVASADAPKSEAIYLRMTAAGGERYSFAFSANGRDWTELGGAVGGGYIEGARVALTAGGGAARFDWIKITPAPTQEILKVEDGALDQVSQSLRARLLARLKLYLESMAKDDLGTVFDLLPEGCRYGLSKDEWLKQVHIDSPGRIQQFTVEDVYKGDYTSGGKLNGEKWNVKGCGTYRKGNQSVNYKVSVGALLSDGEWYFCYIGELIEGADNQRVPCSDAER